jgi:uncharacterized membrane protein (DUF2068 family)
MKNKTLAIFGIGTYLWLVYSSATNAEGQSIVPAYIVVISGIASALFTIWATVRLWKTSKFTSLLFAVTSVIFFGLEVMQVVISPSYGSPLILTLNITKVISLLTFFYVVFLLWRTPNEFNRKSI